MCKAWQNNVSPKNMSHYLQDENENTKKRVVVVVVVVVVDYWAQSICSHDRCLHIFVMISSTIISSESLFVHWWFAEQYIQEYEKT
jgi:hypothetical protein